MKDPSQASSAQSSPGESRLGSGKRGGHTLAWVVGIIVALPVVLIAGIYIHNKAIGPVGWAQDNTEKALREHMKDPGSMVIRSSYVVQKTDAKGNQLIYICGIVDGKNSFGGYAGGTRFASKSEYSKALDTFDTWSVQIEDPEQERSAREVGMLSGFDSVYWNDWCVDASHPAIVASKGG
ncbi:hypothetical protein [Dokdonella fugitiva]|uniref:hypothetical protein n=1 Tax=Dokdonella fugitiva TaxID=328517 RepID=UPI001F54073D|nr:hypothetical protein [Dokdonella fugitiva]